MQKYNFFVLVIRTFKIYFLNSFLIRIEILDFVFVQFYIAIYNSHKDTVTPSYRDWFYRIAEDNTIGLWIGTHFLI